MLLGPVDPTTMPAPEEKEVTEDELRREEARAEMPEAHNLFLLQDFEFWAERVLTGTAWSYYRSASDEEQSKSYCLERNDWSQRLTQPQHSTKIATPSRGTSSGLGYYGTRVSDRPSHHFSECRPRCPCSSRQPPWPNLAILSARST